jgi:hypothetical protein
MEKKFRSTGVSIIGGWFILQGLVTLSKGSNRIDTFVLGGALIVIAIGLFRLVNKARIAAIAVWSALFVIQLFGVIISLIAINQKLPESVNINLSKELSQLILCGLISLGLFHFFTRSKIKEQFK